MVGALELFRVCCRLVGFSRVASKVTRLPVKPDRVRKYLSGMHYQYTPLYPVSVSGPGGSTTPCIFEECIRVVGIVAVNNQKPSSASSLFTSVSIKLLDPFNTYFS